MTPRKDPDEVKITVMCDIIVSDKQWRELMISHGKNMDTVVTSGHVQRAAKTILKRNFEAMGSPQPHIPDYGA